MAEMTVKVDAKLTDLIDPNLLSPNPWNTNVVSPENEARIENSMGELGFFRPVIVRTLEDGSLQILGGEHRWQIAQKHGLKHIPVFNVGKIDDAKAKKISLADNARYGEDDATQLGELLKGLGSAEELGRILPFQDADIQHLLSLSSIDTTGLDLPDDAPPVTPPTLPPPTHVIMRMKVPVEDQAWVVAALEKVMKRENFTSDDSMTNAGNALVQLCKKERDA